MTHIQDRFLELTRRTYPHGDESNLNHLLRKYYLNQDEFGNYYIIIKEKK